MRNKSQECANQTNFLSRLHALPCLSVPAHKPTFGDPESAPRKVSVHAQNAVSQNQSHVSTNVSHHGIGIID